MFFKLFKNFAASHHDIWIFVGCRGLTSPVILLQPSHTVGFIRRHLTKEFSFAPRRRMNSFPQSFAFATILSKSEVTS